MAKNNPHLDRKTTDLELSTRTQNALKYNGIVYIGDLVQKTEAEMLRVPNFGRTCLRELREVLRNMDLSFGLTVIDSVAELAQEASDDEVDLDARSRIRCILVKLEKAEMQKIEEESRIKEYKVEYKFEMCRITMQNDDCGFAELEKIYQILGG